MVILLVLAATLALAVPLLGARWIDHRELAWQRDRWLGAIVGVGVVGVGLWEPMLGTALAAVLVWWRHQRVLPSVVTWVGVTGLWFLARAIPMEWRVLLVLGLLAVAVLETGLILVQSLAGLAPMGTFGHRTLAGAFLAVLCPLAFVVHWTLGAALLIGLGVTCSWVAWLAAAVALAWIAPWTLVVSGSGFVLLAALSWRLWFVAPHGINGRDVWIDRWLGIRGVSLDGLRARVIAWTWLVRDLTWRGHGPGGTHRALAVGFVRAGRRGIEGSPAHNDVLEYLYDYGALGAVTVGLAAWRILPALRFGEPLAAAVIAGLILMQGTAFLQSPATGVSWVIFAAWVA